MYTAEVDMEILEKDVIEAVFQIDEKYEIVSGDERIYQLLGENSMFPLNKLIHPQDLEEFEAFIKSDDSEKPHIARCLVKNNLFRWLLFYKKGIIESNYKKLYELKIQNVVAVGNKFDNYFRKVRKYRGAINLMREKLFDYDFNTELITIYCYINNRSEIIERDYLPDWKNRMLRLGFVDKGAKEQFELLCSNIENGSDSFSLTFETSIMSKGERKDTLNFRGQTIKEGTEKLLVTGIISEFGARMTEGQIMVTSEEGIVDSATGVLNKKTVQNEIKNIIDKARDSSSKELMYLVIMDIDDFKSVNDTYGHYFGDEVILEFAQTLNKVVGDRGLVGRIGGDEFLALIRNVDSEEDVRTILKTVRQSVALTLHEKQAGYHFTISAGISMFGTDSKKYEELFKIADAVLYIAKGKGKDRLIIYDKDKHGAFLQDTLKYGHTIYSGGFMKPMEKYDLASKLIIQVEHAGKNGVQPALKELVDKLNIHEITVYYGEGLKKVLSVGHNQNTIDKADYILQENYFETFDEYEIKKISNVASLAIDFPDVFRMFKESNICSSLQLIIGDKQQGIGMLQFDIFGENRRKWNDDDINVIKMIVKAVEDVFIKVGR